jgi:beta-lactamase regulating signal transducer with metallopeptidase domain
MIAALLDHLWQSTLFCVAAWLITLTLRSNGAALRHAVWLLASLKFLVPFSVFIGIGSYIGLPAARIADNQPLFLGDALQSAATLVAPTSALRAADADSTSFFAVALLTIWLGGAALVALRWLAAWRVVNSMVRAARPAPGAPADARITHADIEPAVARVFHPVVLLPAALLGRLSDAQMNAVLAHEYQHIERRDNLTARIHGLVEMLFWFHPMAWWIGRQLLEERERACDEAVLDRGHDPGDYAAGILEVCRHCCASARKPKSFLPVAGVVAGDLTRRIRWILVGTQPKCPGFFKTVALLTCALAVAAAPLVAGAEGDAVRRRELLIINARNLEGADVLIGPAAAGMGTRNDVRAADNVLLIRNSTLRDLVALAYGVEPWEVVGGPWLDAQRYDIRALAPSAISEPDELSPHALRGLVNKLLASRFDLEIQVMERCQTSCSRYAQAVANDAQ